jgi:hypothetical protein
MRVLLLLSTLVVSGLTASQSAAAEKAVIGLIAVYSGQFVPADGEQTTRAVFDKASGINRTGGVLGKELVVLRRDSQRDPELAHLRAVQLAVVERAQFVLIHDYRECAFAASRALEEHKVPHAAVLIGSPSPAAEAVALLEAWLERVMAAGKFELSNGVERKAKDSVSYSSTERDFLTSQR